jgi:hypothetical protein
MDQRAHDNFGHKNCLLLVRFILFCRNALFWFVFSLEITMEALKQGADTLFILLGAIMVLAMHAGFAFLELGTVRRKNQVNALVKILVDFSVSTVVYFSVGYGVAYGTSFWIGKLDTITLDTSSYLALGQLSSGKFQGLRNPVKFSCSIITTDNSTTDIKFIYHIHSFFINYTYIIT